MLRAVSCSILAVGLACARDSSTACGGFGQKGRWHLDMISSETGLHLDATIEEVGGHLRLTGTSTSREGTREPLDYSVDSLRFFGDSLSFAFAPLSIGVIGHCLRDGTIAGRFTHPQTAPFGPIIGQGTIRHL